jgi:protein-tyrosine-phosphatase
MAEAILRHMKKDFDVQSAGVFAANGHPASQQTIEVLKQKNIECNHQSQQLTRELLDWADLVLTMTNSHKDIVLQEFPGVLHKVHTLKEFVGEQEKDISDPFGSSVDIYVQTFVEIESAIKKLTKKLKS